MARMLSQIATIIRGSVGGLTFSANQFYQIIIRARTAPVQPNTTAQQLARVALLAAQGTWNGLSTSVKTGWDLFSGFLQWPDPLGTHTVPGRQTFIAGRSIQNYCLARGFATPTFNTTPPLPFAGFYLPQNITLVAPALPGTGIGVSITPETGIDALVLIEIMGPFSNSRNRYKGPWDDSKTVAVIIPAATSTVVDFIGFTDGDIIFARIKMVADDAPPRVSAQTILRGVASTIP